MSRLEQELRNAMRREDPPEGFVDRLLARAGEPERNAWKRILAWRSLRWAMAGAVCLLFAAATVEYRHLRQERARGEAAKEQLMLALRIAGSKLQIAQSRVDQIGTTE
jgi:hypothetical protein